MKTIVNNNTGHCGVRECRIDAGITPDDVETLLGMAAASGLFPSDVMMSIEDMAWGSAYGGGNGLHSFLKATVVESNQDRFVGFISYGSIPHWAKNYEMFCIAVEPEFQRLGIGSALVSEMYRRIAHDGGGHVFLEAGLDRIFEESRLFYEANGFHAEHRYVKQFIPNEGGIVYRCDVDADNDDNHYQ